HAVPLLDGDLHERAALENAVEGRVVHQDVDAAESREGLGGEPQRVPFTRHVALHPQRLSAPGLDLLDRGLRVGDVRYHDPRALRRDAEAVRLADAPGSSGDDDDLVLDPHGASYSWHVLTYTPGEHGACRVCGRTRCALGAH